MFAACVSNAAPDMTPAELKSARQFLGLSAEAFARLVQVESGRTVRRWEAGERSIPGPVIALVETAIAVPAAFSYLLRRPEHLLRRPEPR